MSGIAGALAALGQLGHPRLTNRSVIHSVSAPSTATVQIRFGTDGILTTFVGVTGTTREPEWGGFALGYSGLGDFYEIKLSVTSGENPNGTSALRDTWLDLSTQRTWGIATPSPGIYVGSWLVQIRDKTTQTVRASATYSMLAQST